jgi:hypothetical protein
MGVGLTDERLYVEGKMMNFSYEWYMHGPLLLPDLTEMTTLV